jgi:hypothetical protein
MKMDMRLKGETKARREEEKKELGRSPRVKQNLRHSVEEIVEFVKHRNQCEKGTCSECDLIRPIVEKLERALAGQEEGQPK